MSRILTKDCAQMGRKSRTGQEKSDEKIEFSLEYLATLPLHPGGAKIDPDLVLPTWFWTSASD